MQWTVGGGFVRCRLQICKALRCLFWYHVVAGLEWSRQWLPAEIFDRPHRRVTVPVLKHRCSPARYETGRIDRGRSSFLFKRTVDAGLVSVRSQAAKLSGRLNAKREVSLEWQTDRI